MKLSNEFQQNLLKSATRMSYVVALLFSASFITSCDDDDDKGFPSVQGSWAGTKTEVEFKINGVPTPITETDNSFSGEVEFLSNGTAVYSEDGDEMEGTWSQNGEKLTLTIPSDDGFDMSGLYIIKELNNSKLKIYLEKETTFYDDDTQTEFEGVIKATLYFNKK